MKKTNSYLVPTVIEQSGQGERAFDIYIYSTDVE